MTKTDSTDRLAAMSVDDKTRMIAEWMGWERHELGGPFKDWDWRDRLTKRHGAAQDWNPFANANHCEQVMEKMGGVWNLHRRPSCLDWFVRHETSGFDCHDPSRLHAVCNVTVAVLLEQEARK